MRAILKFVQGLATVLILASHGAAPAAPVTLQFTGALPVAWPGAPAGTGSTLKVSYDSDLLVDYEPDPSVASYGLKPPAQPYPFGSFVFSSGSVQMVGGITTLFVRNGGVGENDEIYIYSYTDDGANNITQFEFAALGKDWFDAASLPLDGSIFTGASSLRLGASPASPRPYLSFDGAALRVQVVPEPGSLALAGLGLAGIAACRRRRHRMAPDVA